MVTQSMDVNNGQSAHGGMGAGSACGRCVQACAQRCAIIVNNKSAVNVDGKQIAKEKQMARSKVLSVRVTEEEHEAVLAEVGNILGIKNGEAVRAKTPSEVLYFMVCGRIDEAVMALRDKKKKEASLAKRRANAEAKKAAQNDAK